MRSLLLVTALVLFAFLSKGQQASFYVAVTGKGQPIILIPGYSCSGEVWNETVSHLKDRYECHVITIAGFGGVAPIKNPVLQTVKNDLIKYIADKKLVKPIIMGHSLGAFMSLWIASAIPDKVGKIICVDGLPAIAAMSNPSVNYDSLKINPVYNAEMVANNFAALPAAGYEKNMTAAMLSQVSDTARAALIAHWSFLSDRKTLGYTIVELSLTDLRPELEKIKTPVLIMASLYGSAEMSYTIMNAQYANLPDKKIEVAQSKHFIMYDAPVWMYKQIDNFLAN